MEINVPRVVRDDAVGVAPVDLAVQVHVGDCQVPLVERIIAQERLFEKSAVRVLAGGDELVRGVVLVGGNQQSAAEAGAGFADGATKRVFVAAAPTRRVEARRAFYHY